MSVNIIVLFIIASTAFCVKLQSSLITVNFYENLQKKQLGPSNCNKYSTYLMNNVMPNGNPQLLMTKHHHLFIAKNHKQTTVTVFKSSCSDRSHYMMTLLGCDNNCQISVCPSCFVTLMLSIYAIWANFLHLLADQFIYEWCV